MDNKPYIIGSEPNEGGWEQHLRTLPDWFDPRELVADANNVPIKSFVWRGGVYSRDDTDTTTADTTAFLAPEFPRVVTKGGEPMSRPDEICIVSADGWRFKPVASPTLTKPVRVVGEA